MFASGLAFNPRSKAINIGCLLSWGAVFLTVGVKSEFLLRDLEIFQKIRNFIEGYGDSTV